MTEEQPITYPPEIQQLIDGGRMALVKENFMMFMAHMIKAIPGNKVEIPLPGDNTRVNLMFDFQSDKITVWEGKEPLIQPATTMPTSATPKLHSH